MWPYTQKLLGSHIIFPKLWYHTDRLLSYSGEKRQLYMLRGNLCFTATSHMPDFFLKKAFQNQEMVIWLRKLCQWMGEKGRKEGGGILTQEMDPSMQQVE